MPPGKYSKVIDALPRMLGTEPIYQDKVEAVKAAMAAEPGFARQGAALARVYAAIRAEKEQAEAALSEINLRLEAATQMMSEQFEAEGTTSIRMAGVGSVSIFLEPYAQVKDREAFRAWCMADGDLRNAMQLPWQTTNSLTKQRLLAGEPEPPGVTVFAKTKVRFGGE